MARSPGTVSLARALSKLGLASRSEAAALIRDGRVSVDGRVARDPNTAVVPERARIAVDGRSLPRPEPLTILLHKPRGVVVTRDDPEGRPTVLDLVRDAGASRGVPNAGPQRGCHAGDAAPAALGCLMPVGRLDLATTGLLLLTNDSRFAAWLTDPANAVPRKYVVTVRGEVTDEVLDRLRSGIVYEGTRLQPSAMAVRKRSRRETHLFVELLEGKNREIRRLFQSAGHEVVRLKRIAFGALLLGTLPVGEWREVPVEELRRAFPGAPVRSPARSRRIRS
jgi:23S rRNA pseudouridine2605 synthase